MKHALDTDHLVAVTAIVVEQGSLLRSAVVGAFWGLGHTSSLFLAAVLVIVLRVRIPERVAMGLEFTVALMLIALGLQAIRAWLVGKGSGQWAVGSGQSGSVSRGSTAPVDNELLRAGRRPYLVGLVHGMAGSAALMLLVLTTIPSPWMALLYVLLFGFGSVAGMLGMSLLLSLPLRFTARRLGGMIGHVRLAAGLASAAFGLFLSWQIGFVDGLFR
jgi:sulfite exporter TauE/SafE